MGRRKAASCALRESCQDEKFLAAWKLPVQPVWIPALQIADRLLSREFHPQGDILLNFGHFSGSDYTILVRVAPKWSRMNRARNVIAKATDKKVLLR